MAKILLLKRMGGSVRLIQVYEKLEKTVDKDVVVQYIQHPQIAKRFRQLSGTFLQVPYRLSDR